MEINRPDILAELTDVFHRYEAALTGNDIATLDGLFWQSEEVVRLGAGENLYGFEAIKAFRRGRSPKGLERTLRNTVITTFGTDFGTANTEFLRDGEHRVGRQSHSWVRFADGWKIVAAHVSLMLD